MVESLMMIYTQRVEQCINFFTEDRRGRKKGMKFFSEKDGGWKKSKQTQATEAAGIVESRDAD
jgi:hypothetical protein